ncbi:MAG: nucleotidyltransferase family protein [Clostridia bacterium]
MNNKASGIVCEFNPLHLGHEYILSEMKKNKPVVCIMSGNFVQRGEPAIIDKWERTKMALSCGADLVIELPVSFSLAGAEKFALGSIHLLNSLGFVENICFGSECGDSEKLQLITECIQTNEFNLLIKKYINTGITFAKARELCVLEILGEDYSNVLQGSNNNLAIEYIKAINTLQCDLKINTIKRIGTSHDNLEIDTFPSAMAVRNSIYNNEDLSEFLPKTCLEIYNNAKTNNLCPTDFNKLETAILAKLRTSDNFKNLPDVSEGIDNKLLKSIKTAKNLDELYDLIKSKRFTHARIRRLVLSAFLGIEKNDNLPSFIKILGISKDGSKLLSLKKNTLPIVGKFADVKKLDKTALDEYTLETKCDDIYALCQPKIQPCGLSFTKEIIRM